MQHKNLFFIFKVLMIKNINPDRRLIFEFINPPTQDILENLKEKYNFEINHKMLTAMLPESDLQRLLSTLLEGHKANNISFEDLPVDDSMRKFFQSPDKYLK